MEHQPTKPTSPPPRPGARQIFAEALDRPADERAAFVAEACGGDVALENRVELLLGMLDRAGDFFGGKDRSAGEAETQAAAHPPTVPVDAVSGYDLRREISRGGQGVVYQALQKSTGRKVAVKVLRAGPFASPGERARFDREARILAALDHPNIVTVLDRGVTADGSSFLVMDYVPGRALDDYVASRRADRTADLGALLRLFLKVCDAVNAAHLRGVVHRDLKPSNIRVDDAGEPHVLDFGLARPGLGLGDVEAAASGPVTVTGQFLGSLPWASPEQAQGAADAIDTRSDVYSLGVIFYQMLAGSFPYEVTGSMRDVLENIVTRPPAPMPGAAGVDEALHAITLRALSKSRSDRYQSAGELARDVASYLAGRPTLAGGAAPRRAAWRRAAVPAGVLCALAIAVAVYVRSSDDASARSGAHDAGAGPGGTAVARDELTAAVGAYPPPPALPGAKPRAGVPPFKVQFASGMTPVENLHLVAADQLSTLLHLTGRFETHERAQLEQLLDERNMEGIVRPDELPGAVRGVNYLVIGQITSFRVARQRSSDAAEAGGAGGSAAGEPFGSGRTGFRRTADRITTECGIDIRIVDPTTGRIAAAHFGEFKRTDSAVALGVSVSGPGAAGDAELVIEADDAGKVLRLAIDDAVRKMLPAIDRELARRAGSQK